MAVCTTKAGTATVLPAMSMLLCTTHPLPLLPSRTTPTVDSELAPTLEEAVLTLLVPLLSGLMKVPVLVFPTIPLELP